MNNDEHLPIVPTKTPFLLYTADDAKVHVQVLIHGETIWLTQRQMADLFQTTPENVLMHLKNIYAEEELTEAATTK